MEGDMIDIDEVQEQSSSNINGRHSMQEGVVSRYATMKESAGIPPKRPTRESVLKRLSEALMRRTLTKVSEREGGSDHLLYRYFERDSFYASLFLRLTCHNVDSCPLMLVL